MVSLLSIAVQCTLAALVARVIYLCYFHPLARYPGPWLARFTNLWRFITFLGGDQHIIEQRLHERYGRVVRVAPDWLSFSSLEDFDVIYGFHKAIEKGDFYTFGRTQAPGEGGSIFSTKSDAAHRVKKRKVLGPALTATKAVGYEPIIKRHVDVLISRAEESCLPDGKVNMAPLIHRFTLDTLLEVLFGPNLSSGEPYTDTPAAEGLASTLRVMTKMAWSFSLWPAYGWLMNSRLVNRVIRKPTFNKDGTPTGMAALGSAVRRIITQAEETTQCPQPGIIKSWLQVPLDDANRMTQGELTSEAINLVIAGPGSTAAAVTAILFQLGSEEGQVWQAKIRDEAKVRDDHSGGNDSPPLTPGSFPPYLNAVIKETIRFYAPFPIAFPRVITPGAETALSSALSAPLPVGTTVSANIYVLGRSREIWGPDVDEWLPQRWVGVTDESQRRQMDAQFVSFSKGARGCVGREVALLTIGVAVMDLVKNWRFKSIGKLQGNCCLEMQYEDCWIEYDRLN